MLYRCLSFVDTFKVIFLACLKVPPSSLLLYGKQLIVALLAAASERAAKSEFPFAF